MTVTEQPVRAEPYAADRFAFGENWRRFLARLTPERVAGAEESLRAMLGRDRLDGLRFLDVGSGSGLFSLAARRLGAHVVSFDFDGESVACTRELRNCFHPDDAHWRVEQGSVLDAEFLASLGTFDVVYAWGVLHHTGAMWTALDNTVRALAPSGVLVVALYNDQGAASRYWHRVKRLYHRGGLARGAMLALHVPYFVGARRIVRRLSGRSRLDRGMSYWYDTRDWLGGLPFEVASRERVSLHMAARGLELVRLAGCGNRLGCNEFVFRRAAADRQRRAANAATVDARTNRILFLTRALGFGGAERQLAVLARGLHAAGHDVHVATLYGGGAFEQELERCGVPVHVLGKRGRWDLGPLARTLGALVRGLKPDIVHSYLVVPNIVSASLRLAGVRAKIVWGVRASTVDWRQYDWSFRASFEVSRAASRAAHLIIVNSEAGRRFHAAHGYPDHRMVVVPNGIDVAQFAPDPETRRTTRRAWNVDDETPVVGMVGRLDPMKGHELFLRTVPLLRDRLPGARFVVVGDGPEPYARQMRALSDTLGVGDRVQWLDARRDVRAVYAALDVLVSTSRWGEGFPNVVAEAMATGTPCVVTDCGDSADVVGDTGAVVRARDAGDAGVTGDATAIATANAIEQMLMMDRSARAALGGRARARIVEHFSIDRLVSNTEAALGALLAAR